MTVAEFINESVVDLMVVFETVEVGCILKDVVIGCLAIVGESESAFLDTVVKSGNSVVIVISSWVML